MKEPVHAAASTPPVDGERVFPPNDEEPERARTLAVLGELAARVAHEIKNPLAGIYAATRVLAHGMDRDDERRAVLENVQREIRRLDDTVLELLRFARPEPFRPRPTELRNLARDVLEPLSRRFAPQGVEIRLEIPEKVIASVDGKLLGQALTNLVVNAAQALDRAGTVAIEARIEGQAVAIDVRDAGPGIPGDLLERIFEPFFTTRARGSGLGLAIARRNVEAHGGTLSASNLPEGGACFQLRLPLDRC